MGKITERKNPGIAQLNSSWAYFHCVVRNNICWSKKRYKTEDNFYKFVALIDYMKIYRCFHPKYSICMLGICMTDNFLYFFQA